jgi:hypothetical protein
MAIIDAEISCICKTKKAWCYASMALIEDAKIRAGSGSEQVRDRLLKAPEKALFPF